MIIKKNLPSISIPLVLIFRQISAFSFVNAEKVLQRNYEVHKLIRQLIFKLYSYGTVSGSDKNSQILWFFNFQNKINGMYHLITLTGVLSKYFLLLQINLAMTSLFIANLNQK